MNISYNWLKTLIDIDQSPTEVAEQLTRVGLAVEGVHPHKDDFVFDIDLTSNRPDCLSHFGVARELSVIARPKAVLVSGAAAIPDSISNGDTDLVSIEAPDLCYRFTARIIRGVKIGPSPLWLVNRLEAIGERSINNVADITNYVMHELGQPMHAFDLDKLTGNRIVVRRANANEPIQTLDEVCRKLDSSMLAICDAERPVAVAGVMGGFEASITDSTVNVLLEVAYFEPANIRATSRSLSLSTEASYRFERGVDIENLRRASDRAAELICELAGGTAGEFVDVYPTRFFATSLESKDISAAVLKLTGLDVATDDCIRILTPLGIHQTDRSSFFNVPSWRHDLGIEEDLVEEIARHAGYEMIGCELPATFGAGEYQPTQQRERLLRQTLVNIGFDEAISYSFIDTGHDHIFANAPRIVDETLEDRFVTLRDSVIEGAIRMRSSILPGLLDAIRLNLNYQRRDLKLFELGKVFAAKGSEDGLPNEQEVFSLALTGSEMRQNRSAPVRDLDFYDAKGAVEAALGAIGMGGAVFAAAEVKHLRRGQSAIIEIDGNPVGSVGRLSDEISVAYKFRQPVFVAEINLEMVLELPTEAPTYTPLARYPGISRDISFVAKKDVSFGDIASAAKALSFELCRNVLFVDVFEGKGLADDERSITIRLEYRSDKSTLVEAEVEAMHQQIVAAIIKKTGVKLRG